MLEARSAQTPFAGSKLSHRSDHHETATGESIRIEEARLRSRGHELRKGRSRETDQRRKLVLATEIAEAEIDLYTFRDEHGFKPIGGQPPKRTLFDLKIEQLEAKVGLLSHDYTERSLIHRPEPASSSRASFTDWSSWDEEDIPRDLPRLDNLMEDSETEFVTLPGGWLQGSGVVPPVREGSKLRVPDTMLFMRPRFRDQIKFMADILENELCGIV